MIVYGVYPMQKPDAVGYLNNPSAGCGDGTDEVFVPARFVDNDCGSRIQNTNVVTGNF